MALIDLNLPKLFEAYAGSEEGLAPPSLRRVPTGRPVQTTPEMIDAAIERAKQERLRIMAQRRTERSHAKRRAERAAALEKVGSDSDHGKNERDVEDQRNARVRSEGGARRPDASR